MRFIFFDSIKIVHEIRFVPIFVLLKYLNLACSRVLHVVLTWVAAAHATCSYLVFDSRRLYSKCEYTSPGYGV